ncbi:MAG: ATP-binding protein [Candidatus Brocadiae bacterium]|nr:ATP-binding protein [Candidatus Brocadiia bacterium]
MDSKIEKNFNDDNFSSLDSFLFGDEMLHWLKKIQMAKGDEIENIKKEFCIFLSEFWQDIPEKRRKKQISYAIGKLWQRIYQKPVLDTLDEPKLRRDIIEFYPRPIAYAYHRLVNDYGNETERFNAMIDTSEALSHCLAAIALGIYFSLQQRDPDWDSQLLTSFVSHGALSFGTWVEIAIGTAQRLANKKDSFPELIDFLNESSSQSRLRSFVMLRNQKLAHAYCREDSHYANNLDLYIQNLQELLFACSCLKNISLLVPVQYDHEYLIIADKYVGIHFFRNLVLTQPLTIGNKMEELPKDRAILAYHEINYDWIPLYPLWLWHYWVRKNSQGTYCVSNIVWSNKLQRTVKSLKYQAYESNLARSEETMTLHSEETENKAMQQILASLHGLEEKHIQEEEENPFEMIEMEQKQHLDWFIGRENTIKKWRSMLEKQDGYVVFFASPGTGKSAMVTKITSILRKEKQAVLCHMIKSLTSPLSFLPYLIKQGQALCHEKLYVPQADANGLSEIFTKTLQKLVKKYSKIFVFLDGLDELEDGFKNLKWLPASIPEHVSFLLTSRNDSQIKICLRDRVKIYKTFPEWKPLENKDIENLLAQKLSLEQQQVLKESGLKQELFRQKDFPLGIVTTLNIIQDFDCISEEGRRSVSELVNTFKKESKSIHAYWYEHATGKHAKQLSEKEKTLRKQILHFLAVSYIPLGIRELQKILECNEIIASLEEIRDALLGFYNYLVEKNNEEFLLCHQTFYEYIWQAIGEGEIQKLHGKIAEWLLSSKEKQESSNITLNLSKSRQYDRLIDFLTNLFWAFQWVQLKKTYQLIKDICLAINVCPENTPGFQNLQIFALAMIHNAEQMSKAPERFWEILYKEWKPQENNPSIAKYLSLVQTQLLEMPDMPEIVDPGQKKISFSFIPGDFWDMVFCGDSRSIAVLLGNEKGMSIYDCHSTQKKKNIKFGSEFEGTPHKIFYDEKKSAIIVWASHSVEQHLINYLYYNGIDGKFHREIKEGTRHDFYMSNGLFYIFLEQFRFRISTTCSMYLMIFALVSLIPFICKILGYDYLFFIEQKLLRFAIQIILFVINVTILYFSLLFRRQFDKSLTQYTIHLKNFHENKIEQFTKYTLEILQGSLLDYQMSEDQTYLMVVQVKRIFEKNSNDIITVTIIDCKKHKKIIQFSYKSFSWAWSNAVMSKDGKILVIAEEKKVLRIFDLEKETNFSITNLFENLGIDRIYYVFRKDCPVVLGNFFQERGESKEFFIGLCKIQENNCHDVIKLVSFMEDSKYFGVSRVVDVSQDEQAIAIRNFQTNEIVICHPFGENL